MHKEIINILKTPLPLNYRLTNLNKLNLDKDLLEIAYTILTPLEFENFAKYYTISDNDIQNLLDKDYMEEYNNLIYFTLTPQQLEMINISPKCNRTVLMNVKNLYKKFNNYEEVMKYILRYWPADRILYHAEEIKEIMLKTYDYIFKAPLYSLFTAKYFFMMLKFMPEKYDLISKLQSQISNCYINQHFLDFYYQFDISLPYIDIPFQNKNQIKHQLIYNTSIEYDNETIYDFELTVEELEYLCLKRQIYIPNLLNNTITPLKTYIEFMKKNSENLGSFLQFTPNDYFYFNIYSKASLEERIEFLELLYNFTGLYNLNYLKKGYPFYNDLQYINIKEKDLNNFTFSIQYRTIMPCVPGLKIATIKDFLKQFE